MSKTKSSRYCRTLVVAAAGVTSVILLCWKNPKTPAVVHAYLAPHNPPWEPITYGNILSSLITMQSNVSGTSNATRGAEFGIVSYDWSTNKSHWAVDKPMTCEETLFRQAVYTKNKTSKSSKHNKKNQNKKNRVFVYRNIVKALPWFATVRTKLNDPAYAGFFLPFAADKGGRRGYHVPRCARENASHCSAYYHDQQQTPQVPTAEDPHPDGSCVGYCDCGIRIPCGEYLFDHRNGTMLREFLVNELVLSETTGAGNDVIDGVFLDDYWCSDLLCRASNDTIDISCPCNDPVQGATEIDMYQQRDMGLTDEDIRDITLAWNETMSAVQRALLERGKYSWDLMHGQQNANADPTLLHRDTCAEQLRDACGVDNKNSVWQRYATLFGFTVAANGTDLVQLHQDLAFFLLVRGNYTYAGWGTWGMVWPFNAEPAHGELPPIPEGGVPLPAEFYWDYGRPVEDPVTGTYSLCFETTEEKSNVFRRHWTKSAVELDCNTFEATIELLLDSENGGSSSSAVQ